MATQVKRPQPDKRSQPEPEGEDRGKYGAPPDPGDAAPAGVEEALARARRHGRAAAAEAVAAVRALLDAASLGVSGEPSESHAGLATLARSLDELAASLNVEASDRSLPMVEAILEALDGEIRRWEARSADDTEARAVLRAFLGVREILWEFGLRRTEADEAEAPRRRSAQAHKPTPERGPGEPGKSPIHLDPKPPRSSGRRVQRVKVQG